ncbi:MAG: hypothetical protein Q9166_000958 [cf. Caloplaca sp. 2 TL-2023]
MRSLSLALFAAGALAGNLIQILPRELQVRQDQSFVPGTESFRGATCAVRGVGYINCSSVYCYNPGRGETCCRGGGDAYPCPSGSFCLNVNRRCCRNGLSRETCAAQNGVSLPDNSNTATSVISGSTTASSSTVSAVESSTVSAIESSTVSAVESSTVSSSAFVTGTTVIEPTFYPIPGNLTVAPTATGTSSPSGTGAPGPITPFIGAASSVQVVGGALAASLLGVVAMLL